MSLKSVLEERNRGRRSKQEQARAEIRKLAAELRQRFVFRFLYLIGSLAKGRFSSRSDIDLKPYEDLSPDEQSRIVQEVISIG